MTTDAQLSPSVSAAIARSRARLYDFVALHFNIVMDASFVDKIRTSEFRAILEAMGDGKDNEDPITLGALQMAVFIEKTRNEDTKPFADRLGAERTRLYRGISPDYGPVPPYAALWTGKKENEEQLLQKLTVFYQQAGVRLGSEHFERLDYLGVELAFMQVLADREADAWDNENEAEANSLFEVQKRFFNTHLSWVSNYVNKALENTTADFYRAHLRILEGLMLAEEEILV